jgi:carboxymethylenebutenolidase
MRSILTRLAPFTIPLALLSGCSPEPEPAPAPTTTVPAAPSGPVLRPGDVVITSGTDEIVAYLAKPKGQGPFPALVVIHEWWGLNDQIRGMADQFAKQGYLSLALDLYRGKVTDNPDQAHELMRGLPEDRAMRDLAAAYAYLKASSDANPDRIGSVGWCMGGGFSLKLAMAEPTLAACAVYYGAVPSEPESLAAIQTPVIGFFGEKDEGIPEASVLAFETAMQKQGKSAEVHVYRNAGHGFANSKSKSYHNIAADDAWGKLMAFFGKHLKGA